LGAGAGNGAGAPAIFVGAGAGAETYLMYGEPGEYRESCLTIKPKYGQAVGDMDGYIGLPRPLPSNVRAGRLNRAALLFTGTIWMMVSRLHIC
jgi:hypothetical protein